jgi:hypothetical protein
VSVAWVWWTLISSCFLVVVSGMGGWAAQAEPERVKQQP